MRFNFYSPVHFEKWDHRSSTVRGIGGSETMHTEMCWRLGRRGHEVYSYAPIPRDCPKRWRGTTWARLEDADFAAEGIWVVLRDAACLDRITPTDRRKVWLVCQDEAPVNITPERAAKCERVVALCQWHKRHLETNWPEVKGKVVVSSNGIKTDLIREVESAGHQNQRLVGTEVPSVRRGAAAVGVLAGGSGRGERLNRELPKRNVLHAGVLPAPRGSGSSAGGGVVRNPKRIMYASSPDRGLLPLLKIFRRVREFVPDAELHCFYGIVNIEKMIRWNPQRFGHYKTFVAELKAELKQPGVTWHGRVSQKQLYREYFKSGIWCYPTNFSETSAIVCMENQAMGCVPICSPKAALAENVTSGCFVPGDPNDGLVRDSFVAEIVRLMWHPVIQDDHRRTMMPEARARFAWDRQVDQWEGWLYGWAGRFGYAQFAFQLKHATGRILNVGCADDPAGFGAHGATNLDAAKEVPWSKKPTAAHVYHDARRPIPAALGKYDTVILGDLLEHLTDGDAVKVLRNARAVLAPKGRVVVTCPEDARPAAAQHAGKTGLKYQTGESAYHERPVTKAMLAGWLAKAGLKTKLYQELDYAHCSGHGVVAVRG